MGGCVGKGGVCQGPLSSHPHCLFSSVCRSGCSSDNHYYRVPHHGHSCADNNSCLKKLVRPLLLCWAWGVAWDGDRVGMEVPIPLQVPKPVAPAKIAGGIGGLQENLQRRLMYQGSAVFSQFPHLTLPGQWLWGPACAQVGWTSLMGHVSQHSATWRGQSRVLGHSRCSQDVSSASSSSTAFPKEF